MAGIVCSKCGMELPEEAKFCFGCGAKVVQPKRVCPKCGVELPEEAKFCFSCGEKIDNSVVNFTMVTAKTDVALPLTMDDVLNDIVVIGTVASFNMIGIHTYDVIVNRLNEIIDGYEQEIVRVQNDYSLNNEDKKVKIDELQYLKVKAERDYLFDLDLVLISEDEWKEEIELLASFTVEVMNDQVTGREAVLGSESKELLDRLLIPKDSIEKIKFDIANLVHKHLYKSYKLLFANISRLQSFKLQIRSRENSAENTDFADTAMYVGAGLLAAFNPIVGLPMLAGKYFHSKSQDKDRQLLYDEMANAFQKTLDSLDEIINNDKNLVQEIFNYFKEKHTLFEEQLNNASLYYLKNTGGDESIIIKSIIEENRKLFLEAYANPHDEENAFLLSILEDILLNNDLYGVSQYTYNMLNQIKNNFKQGDGQ